MSFESVFLQKTLFDLKKKPVFISKFVGKKIFKVGFFDFLI